MPFEPLNIAIADENAFFRKTLKGFLVGQSNLRVVTEISTRIDLLNKIMHSPANILIMDLFAGDVNFGDSIRAVQEQCPKIRVVVLSGCNDLDLISDLLEIGIHAFISKEDEPDELLKAIRTVSSNKIYHSHMTTEALYNGFQKRLDRDFVRNPVALSDRETKILELLWQEYSSKEIADTLFLSIRSIEKIRQNLKVKLNVGSTIELIKYAIDRRIITGKIN